MLGGGGHAGTVAETLAQKGESLLGHFAITPGSEFCGDYLGGDADMVRFVEREACFVAIGLGFVNTAGAKLRREILSTLDDDVLPVVVHDRSIVAPSARLSAGVFCAMGATVNTKAKIGRASIVNTGAIVDHDCDIGENCHVATGARLLGNVRTGANCLIGAGATIKQGVQIGDNVIVGAGAVVLDDVASDCTVVGIPAIRCG